MHRAALRALAACASVSAIATSLHAAPLALDAARHQQAPLAVPAPEPVEAAPEPVEAAPEPAPVRVAQSMGGGFIEFLFRGGQEPQPQYYPQQQYVPPPQYAAPPRYAPPPVPYAEPQPRYAPPQPQYMPQPQYAAQPQYPAPQPQYEPQPQYAAPQPQPQYEAPRLLNPLEALFGGGSQRAPEPVQQQASYEPDPNDDGYQDPNVRNPRRPPASAVPQPGPHSVAPRDPAARYQINPKFLKQIVPYDGKEAAGTIIIDTPNKFLYLVQGNGQAIRYGVGVGRPGFTWAGVKHVSLKREWPDWTPPPEMLKRQPDLPRHMAGGPRNPLGARALYLGSSLYRIHGSNEPWTIGTNVSSGCIRMRNEDVIDLYDRVKVGTKVVVI